MEESRFSSWKYRHRGRGYRSRRRLILAGGLLIGAVAALAGGVPPLAIFLLIVGLIALFVGAKKILLGPRYLICGGEIIYFANVERVDRDEVAGTLCLACGGERRWTLEREKFPTNARKADKMHRNRAAKFAKVADRIVAHVQAANPGAEIRVHA